MQFVQVDFLNDEIFEIFQSSFIYQFNLYTDLTSKVTALLCLNKYRHKNRMKNFT